MALSSGPSGSGMVVLLLGEKLSGKSSTGNIILGRRAFGINTKYSSKATSVIFGKQVTVVDTPGWQPHSPTTVFQELMRGLTLCGSDPDVILLVLSVLSPFGPEQWGAMQAQMRMLQNQIWQRVMLLFTDGDCLGLMPIQEHIRRQGRTLQWLVEEQCGNRYHILTNQLGTSQSEVRQLLVKMQRIADSSRSAAGNYRDVIRDVSRRQEWSRLGRQEHIEMVSVPNGLNLSVYAPQKRQGQGRSAAPRLPTALPSYRAVPKSPLSLVLLGRRKSGKSTVGNLILNTRQFKMDTKTSRCSVGQGLVSGCSVTVVDTPGWSLYGLSNPEHVKTEISRSPSLCPIWTKMVFLLLVPADAFKEKDRKAVELYLSVLGDNIWRKIMVLFTFGDEFGGETVEKRVEKQGQALQWLMQRCGYRHHVFDTNIGNNTQVLHLLDMVQQM